MRRVAVVGGGWAGLAAAIEATLQGDAVTLFEMAPQLGGRARTVHAGGLPLDNGQHILIGAYRETLRLMHTVGVDPAAAFVRTPLHMAYPNERGLQLPAGSPALAFARGVIGLRTWPVRERLALLAAASGWAWRRFRCDEHSTVTELTAHLSPTTRRDLIDPLCIAALNTPSQLASASVFLRVIRDALFSGPGSADLLIPKVRLSDLFPGPATHWLEGAGASIHLSHRVNHIASAKNGWRVDDTGFDRVVLASTAVEAARLVQSIEPSWAATAQALHYEPIVTVYAQSDGTTLPHPMLALRSDDGQRPAQFVFDHGQLGGCPGQLAFVISGAQSWVDRGADATRDATLAQAREALERHLRAPLRTVHLLTDKRATFRCTPGLRRPAAAIAPDLIAAGDYVAGPYPATLEGAVRSGIFAVRSV